MGCISVSGATRTRQASSQSSRASTCVCTTSAMKMRRCSASTTDRTRHSADGAIGGKRDSLEFAELGRQKARLVDVPSGRHPEVVDESDHRLGRHVDAECPMGEHSARRVVRRAERNDDQRRSDPEHGAVADGREVRTAVDHGADEDDGNGSNVRDSPDLRLVHSHLAFAALRPLDREECDQPASPFRRSVPPASWRGASDLASMRDAR